MIDAGKLVRVKNLKQGKTQLGSTNKDDPDWRYPEVTSGDLVTVLGRTDWGAVIVLATVDGMPRVGWLYNYEVEMIETIADNSEER